jgi:D-beta-D-heptose 7-phosphate kinase/D-beta-D-heptose 1-phosphate adenosyltransferase
MEVAMSDPLEILQRIHGVRVLVVGDIMLDKYSWCAVERISPEAPVPVATLREETYVPGGCGNVAANVISLGGQADVCSVVGGGYYGEVLADTLRDYGVDSHSLIPEPGRTTTVKNRIVAGSQQMMRMDRERATPLTPGQETRFLAAVESAVARADACVISDYAKGVVTPRVSQAVIRQALSLDIPVVVDPKGHDYEKYRGATIITPNTPELFQSLSLPFDRNADIQALSQQLRDRIGVEVVLTTRGAEGMSLLIEDGAYITIPTIARQVSDVTGAGDTVVAMLALSLGEGADPEQAALLSNVAAGVVVAKLGTATVSQQEVIDHLERSQLKGSKQVPRS